MKFCFFTTLLVSAVSLFSPAQEMSMTPNFPRNRSNSLKRKFDRLFPSIASSATPRKGTRFAEASFSTQGKRVSQGGDSGPAVVPHNINESLLYVAITYQDDSLEMPPKYKLPDDVISDFKRWIELGAPDPRKKCRQAYQVLDLYQHDRCRKRPRRALGLSKTCHAPFGSFRCQRV